MAQEQAGGRGSDHGQAAGRDKYFYFVDDQKYEWDAASISGSQIRARIPNLNPAYQVFWEKPGNEPDVLVQDNTAIPLTREHEGVPHLYTVAPATFGAA